MSQRKVTKRTAPKPEPRHRRPGGGRKLAPLHVTPNNHGGDQIIITVTHLTLGERQEVLATNHSFWMLEMNRSLIALIAAKRAAKGLA